MRIIKRVRISLTRAQEKRCRDILDGLRGLWNRYVDIQRKYLALERGWIQPNTFSKDFYPQLVQIEPWIKDLPCKARQSMYKDCIKSMVSEMKHSHSISFRSKRKRPITSFNFERVGIRFTSRNRMWIPLIHSVKLCEVGYITDTDIPCITSGRVMLDGNEWYLSFKMDVPDDYYGTLQPTEFSAGGISIDLGIRTYVTVSSPIMEGGLRLQNHSYQISLDPKSREIQRKIAKLNRIITHKVHWNRKRFGYEWNERIAKSDVRAIYHSQSIESIRRQVSKLYKQLSNHKYDSLKKATAILVKAKPLFIAVEELDTIALKTQHTNRVLRKENADCCFSYFLEYIRWQGRKYGIPIIEVPQFTPTTRQCSACGDINTQLTLNDRMFWCDRCGLRINRDINAARNILRYGNEHHQHLAPWNSFEELVNSCS